VALAGKVALALVLDESHIAPADNVRLVRQLNVRRSVPT
jgi:hypothetical protein